MSKVPDILEAAGRGNLPKLQQLLDDGHDVNWANEIGCTPLMAAVRSYRIDCARLLVERGADVDAVTEDGQAVLHCAVGGTPSIPEDQAACVRLLLESSANGNVTTPIGVTPLAQAAWFGCEEAAKVMIAFGVDQTARDRDGQTAKEIAEERGYPNIAALLE